MPIIRDEETDNITLDSMAHLHPEGQFLAVVGQIAKFRQETMARENKQLIVDDYYVFCFETDDNGVRRQIDYRKMTGKPFSNRSNMGNFLSQAYGGVKPDQLKVKLPQLGALLGQCFIVTISHTESANGGTVYANISAIAPIPVIAGKPAYSNIEVSDEFENYFQRKPGYQRIADPENPSKQIWFRPYKEDDSTEETPSTENFEVAPPARPVPHEPANKAKGMFGGKGNKGNSAPAF